MTDQFINRNSQVVDFSLHDLPKFYQSIKDRSLLIIGNGPSAVQEKFGGQIDRFDCVVRINNYVTKGLESSVGSRTDIWVNGANQGLKKRSELSENILVMIPPVILEQKGKAIHDRIQRRLATDKYFMLPVEMMLKMENMCGIERPTTGFFSIYFFYLLGLNITLHGFDFFVGSTSHYFDTPLKRWLKDKGIIRKAGKHDVGGEKAFIENLIQAGKVKVLNA